MMKNSFLFLFLCLTVGMQAQTFQAYLQGGIAATQIDGDTYWGFNKVGLNLGAFVHTDFKNNWRGKMGLRYIEKGSQKGDNDNAYYYKAKLQYVEMPVMAAYTYKEKFELEGGLTFGYLMRAREAYTDTYLVDTRASYHAFELGGIIGLTYFFQPQWGVNVQYGYSVLPVRAYDSSGSIDYVRRGQYNNLTTLNLIYKFKS